MRWKIVLIAAVVLASGCAQTNTAENPGETSGETDRPQQNNTIFLTGSGFNPSNLEVEQGETVTWIDRSSRTMWVASDRHPTHTRYSGSSTSEHCENGDSTGAVFDQCSTGEKFTFTFEKTGEWGYHNHQPYIEGGTITVAEK